MDDRVPEVSDYEILSELGRGAMGIVYEAKQISLGRTVALKMIMSANATGEELARFVSEAEAVAHLQHPNIVQIYQIGECLGRPFFSLEFVEGGDLEKKLKEGPLAWRDAAKMVSVLARAIHVAHDKGIVHRDLKPANVLLATDGTPKITDFGIAKRLDASNQTQDGKIIGSPSYMAPEQATGRNDLVGPRTDIYALGAILYDMLTGRPPFECDNTMDTLLQTIVGDVVPPRLLQPKLPSDLNVICLKCLEKEPDRRYESALALSLDLDRLLAGDAIHARSIGQVERTQRWVRRHPAWGTLILASILGLLTLAVAGAWFTSELQKELSDAA
jgi:serine/threonine-protein kinase